MGIIFVKCSTNSNAFNPNFSQDHCQKVILSQTSDSIDKPWTCKEPKLWTRWNKSCSSGNEKIRVTQHDNVFMEVLQLFIYFVCITIVPDDKIVGQLENF